MLDYPSTFPCPDLLTYNLQVDMDANMSSIRGDQQVGRGHVCMPTVVSVTFTMKTTAFRSWYTWVKTNGFQWFSIPLFSMYNTKIGSGLAEPHVARFIAPISVSMVKRDYFRVSGQLELSPINFVKGQA